MQTSLIQPHEFVHPGKKMGCLPRDFSMHSQGYLPCAPAFPRDLEMTEAELTVKCDELMHNQATLCDIRLKAGPNGGPIPSRDQDGYGYCWAHSSVSAMLLARAVQNEPYADLSAFAVAAIIKNYRDEGGWGQESLQFIADRGVPTSQFWPQQSMNRANDNPATWADAAKHKAVRWYDMDPDRIWIQMASSLARNWPTINDYNRWSHSVNGARIKDLKGRIHTIWNSWSDSWKDLGMGDLEGSGWFPDNCLALVIGEPS